MRYFLTCVLLCAVGLTGPALALLQAPPPGDGVVLMIGPASTDFEGIAAGFGGYLVGPSQAPFAAFAAFDHPADDLSSKLQGEGVWIAVDGTRLAEICGVSL